MATTPADPASIERRVLDATLESIRTVGVRRATIVDVANRAGVSRTTVYRRWDDLDALMAEALTDRLLGLFARTRIPTDSVARLVEGVVDFADLVRRDELLRDIRAEEPDLLGRYVFRRLGRSQMAFIESFTELLRRTWEADPEHTRARVAQIDDVAAMTLLLVQGAIVSHNLFRDRLDAESWRRELTHALRGYLER